MRVAFVIPVLLFAVLTTGGRAPAAVPAGVPRAAFQDLGEASPASPVSLAVTLNYRHAAELERLVELQNDPASPYYRHWLTSEQFVSAFAPSQAEYVRAMLALQRAGFTVTQSFSNRTVIDVRGSVATAERYFGTRIHRVFQAGYGVRYANVRAATIPSELRPLVFTVNGLNDLSLVHAQYLAVRHRSRTTSYVDDSARPYLGPASSITGERGFGPLVFAQNYDFPTQHATATHLYDGSGRSAAIVIDADFLDSDIATYLSYFGIKRTAKTMRVPVDGGTKAEPGLINPDSVEATLDVETIAANAPGATIYVYQTPPFSFGITGVVDAYNKIVAQNRVDAVNSSFGMCESSDVDADNAMDHIATQAAALGITFHAAAGDYGSSCLPPVPQPFPVLPMAPADSPHFVTVGGTSLKTDAKHHYDYVAETAWNSNDGYAGGGGVSGVFAEPSWQKGVQNMFLSGRNYPDIALDGDPATGTAFYYAATWNNPWNPLGGTSLSSPLFGAALTEIDEIAGGRTGLAGERLFDILKRTSYADDGTVYFHDVTKGNNIGYFCLIGYDNVTGIGSLDVWNIAQALKK